MKEPTLDIPGEFADTLWRLIKERGLSYREASLRARPFLPTGVELSDVSVWNYAKGRAKPRRLAVVEALARGLEVSVDELLGRHRDGVSVRPNGDGTAVVAVQMSISLDAAVEIAKILRTGRVD